MVDFYALFLLVIGLFLQDLKKMWMKTGMVLFFSACIFLNIFQTWQYANGILHPDSMNQKAYWYIFLKSEDRYAGSIGDQDEYFYGKLSDQPFQKTTFHAGRSNHPGWSKPVQKAIAENDSSYLKLDHEIIYSPAYTSSIDDSLHGRNDLYVLFHTLYREKKQDAALGALFVVDISDEESNLLFYKAFRTKRLPDLVTGEWREGHIGFKLPEITPEMHRLKLYIWNQGKQSLDLREMAIGFYTYGN
jgi:hypothetical protein